MGYKLWLPGDPVLGTEGKRCAAPESGRPNAEEIFLTKIAPALRAVVDRLLPLLADHWLGATGRLHQLAPSVLAAIDTAEENAAQTVARFMAGEATEQQFLAAVAEYEASWRRGAEVIERSAHIALPSAKKEGSA